ncbi:MAG: endonuclease domain-containing protein [Patescibacteria group bacterium]
MGIIFNKQRITRTRKLLRRDMPLAEQLLWSKLKNRQIKNYKFRRQHSIGKFIVDFYCPETKLAVELDGDSHFESTAAEKLDSQRQAFLESLGIKVIRFTNREVYENMEGILENLDTLLP